jgi:aminoglycoside 3-N-acetyltransferase
VALNAQDFAEVGAAFEGSPEGGRVRTGKVGAADTRIVPIRPAVDFATAWLREHRPMG